MRACSVEITPDVFYAELELPGRMCPVQKGHEPFRTCHATHFFCRSDQTSGRGDVWKRNNARATGDRGLDSVQERCGIGKRRRGLHFGDLDPITLGSKAPRLSVTWMFLVCDQHLIPAL